jgi:16S rRNA (guanine(966)-N(2))-methyltransferase RsmD
MTIRVIAGEVKGRKLKMVPGETTRPIMDRVKENLFNLIPHDYLTDQRWLDLFGGTGAVGIEALSRGASHCTFVDAGRAAIRVIQDNLETVGFTDRALVRHTDAFQFLEKNSEPFDVIYIAPPQYHGMWVGALTGVEQNIDQLLVPDGIVIVQIDPKEYLEISPKTLAIFKNRTYGSTQLIFYERKVDRTPEETDSF